MVLHTVPNGHMMVNQKSPEQLKAVVKAESPSAKQDFNTGTAQWPSLGGFIQGRSGGFVRVSSPHRHSPISGQSSPRLEHQFNRQSPVSGQSSPRLEHQFNRQRERETSYEEYGQEQKRCRIGNSVHTIHSQMQSHLLSPREITSPRASPSTIHSTVPSPKFSESHGPGDRNGAQVATPPRLTPPVNLNPLDEPSPLGLVLKKTPSLLDLISMKLAQSSSGEQSSGNGNSETLSQDSGATGSAECLVPTVTAQDKLKASNFPASSLKIGTWERLSRYEGDLVGKCYYAKRKLVWEVLESGLKSKIEIQWSDISAMKASYPENLPGTLEIEVSRPPLFFRETNPQPRKHTLWQATSDFTGGQATICKRHSLQFPEGVLNRHYEKLVQCDPRLKALAEGTLSTRAVTEFEHSSWFYDGKLSHLHSHQPTHHPLARHNSGRDVNSNQPSLVLSRMQAMQGSGPLPHAEILLEAKPEVGQIKMQSNDLSPTAGAEGHRNEEGNNVAGEDLRLHNSISDYDRLDLKFQNASNMGVHDLVDMKPARHDLLRVGAGNTAMQSPNAHMGLEEIAQVLLGDPTSSANEPIIFNPSYGPISSPTSGGNFAQQPLVSQTLERSDLPDASQGFSPFRSNGDEGHGDHQLGVMGDPSSFSEILHREMSSSSLLSCINRHGSTSDFQLINFPRVASLPQLFETPQQAPIPVGRYDSTYMRSSYYSSEKLR